MDLVRFLKTKQGYATAMTVAVALALALFLYAFRGIIFPGQPAQGPESPSVSSAYRHPLTGLPIDAPLSSLPQVFGVMVDHSVDAWPQSGVDRAFLVIEAPVEAGIPRLEAFFHEGQQVDKIGPVRSARPYFVDWNDELDGLYAHVGGSDAALDQIGTTGTFDLNQFWNGFAYWRSTDRVAPHNTYTSTDLLGKALAHAREAGKAPTLLYGTWAFKDPSPAQVGTGVTVDFGATSYRVDWTYDGKSGTYSRRQGGLPYAMKDGGTVAADNVVVAVTKMTVIDTVGRREVKTVGEGDMILFQDGRAVRGRWKKPSQTERLRFFDEDTAEIEMNPGMTWIEVVPDAEMVSLHEPPPNS
ncbi:hypothetical protein A2856_03115 [Candidatus Uhrbacteria bacterium RIFCSPHIGHO2_01_FULL_63_20]|uniref:DUF3048 domain-containing protein n=1 Tax=Candidatus Uhrbacteria bacterium RIFCSPHIGHO2_01_FULL_63_20 TaxID=1802385 RepID=A0A1F7TL79_9BACT|nr:MAG: hypothetical protein A2856_03115 [Candidatus Uhrbacteria bacterium RIFCSPHIGHO2_01_FULL_63_20]